VGSGDGKTNVYSNLNVEASDVSLKSQFPVQLSASLPGGDMKLNGKVGPVDASDTLRTPLSAKLTIEALDLARGACTRATRLGVNQVKRLRSPCGPGRPRAM
jgi:hypothetical protein